MSGQGWRIPGAPDELWLGGGAFYTLPGDVEVLDASHAAFAVDGWFADAVLGGPSLTVLQEIASELFAVPLGHDRDVAELTDLLRHALENGRIVTFRPREQPRARDGEDEPIAKGGKKIETTWIEISMVTDERPPRPAAFRAYHLELPDGTFRGGSLDKNGFARVEGIPKGNCQLTFPGIHAKEWKRA